MYATLPTVSRIIGKYYEGPDPINISKFEMDNNFMSDINYYVTFPPPWKRFISLHIYFLEIEDAHKEIQTC